MKSKLLPLKWLELSLKKLVRFIILAYIKLKYYVPFLPKGTCRFYPTCSRYALLSLDKYSLPKAVIKIIWRLLRCNPFNPGGYDPPV